MPCHAKAWKFTRPLSQKEGTLSNQTFVYIKVFTYCNTSWLSLLLGVQLNENSISTAHWLPDTKKIKNRIVVKFVHRDTREKVYKKRASLMRKSTKDLPSVAKETGKSIQRANKTYINKSVTSCWIDCLVESTNSKSQTNSNSHGQLMGRSGPERARHLRFTNLQLMKDEAKKHGSCYFNSIYLIMFLLLLT